MRALGVGGRRPPLGGIVPLLPAGDWGIRDRRGFGALSAIGVIDGASRTAFLTLLPFVLTAKGADLPIIGVALGLTFAGGASGKFLCGVLAERAGILRTVIVTELMTSAGVLLVLALPLGEALVCLPVVGVALNGTSSVLYATVAEFVAAERRTRGFGLFYTVGIGSGALAPFLFGFLGDLYGLGAALLVLAAMICLSVPLCAWLRPALAARPAD
jgi:MFS family permease